MAVNQPVVPSALQAYVMIERASCFGAAGARVPESAHVFATLLDLGELLPLVISYALRLCGEWWRWRIGFVLVVLVRPLFVGVGKSCATSFGRWSLRVCAGGCFAPEAATRHCSSATAFETIESILASLQYSRCSMRTCASAIEKFGNSVRFSHINECTFRRWCNQT